MKAGSKKERGMRNRRDIIASLLFILLGTGVIIESIRLKLGTPLAPHPGFFPFLGGLLLVALAVILLIQGCRVHGEASRQPREAFGEVRRPFILVACMALYTAMLDPVGYVLPTIFIAVVILRVLGVTSWKIISLASLGLSVGTYVLFGRILGIDLPAGVLSFIG
jgi:putative tricarboxylic transport membrane protein